jgi:hypothetical protein
MRTPRLPGFTAAAALGTARSSYRAAGTPGFPEAFGQAILPQQPDLDLPVFPRPVDDYYPDVGYWPPPPRLTATGRCAILSATVGRCIAFVLTSTATTIALPVAAAKTGHK